MIVRAGFVDGTDPSFAEQTKVTANRILTAVLGEGKWCLGDRRGPEWWT